MIPHKAKDLIPGFCEKYGYTGDTAAVVERLIMFQFQKIKEEQDKMEYERLRIPYLGYLFAKPWSVKRAINSINSRLVKIKPKTPRGEITQQNHKAFRDHLEEVYAKMQERFEINKAIIEKSKAEAKETDYGLEDDFSTSMEEQDTD